MENTSAEIIYLCNRKRCEHCNPECEYTTDVEFAKNFVLENGTYVEQKQEV